MQVWKTGLMGIALAGLVPLSASAANQDIQFDGSVTHTCAITVTQSGTLDPRNNFTRLTSRSGPGIPGRANVVASGSGFTLSVDPSTSFDTEPAADTSPETFRAWHRSNGATFYTATQAPAAINAGNNRVRIHMDARKINGSGNVFEAGNYSATVILRCE
jgi:hypothetical protein